MVRKNVLAILLVLLAAFEVSAAEKTILRQMSKEESEKNSRIFLQFSRLPVYRLQTSGQRIDLTLRGTVFDPLCNDLPADGTVVKIAREQSREGIVLSFFLHRPPRQVAAILPLRGRPHPGGKGGGAESAVRFVLDLAWDKNPSVPADQVAARAVAPPPSAGTPEPSVGEPRSRPAIAADLAGVPGRNLDTATAGRFISSVYQGKWADFFTVLDAPVKIRVPLQYSLPSFPCLAVARPHYEEQLRPAVMDYGRAGKWRDVLAVIREIIADQHLESTPELILLQAEALVRDLEYDKALDALARLPADRIDPDVADSRRYLVLYARAAAGHPYDAAYELSRLRSAGGGKSALQPYLKLLEAEIDIGTGQYDKALQVLDCDEKACAGPAADLFVLRRADALFAAGRKFEAAETYRRLPRPLEIIKQQPFSLANLAESLYGRKDYLAAHENYNHLGILLAGQAGQDLAFYNAALSQLQSGPQKDTQLLFKNIIKTFPGTEGEMRARLKVNDLGILSGEESAKLTAMREYEEIATKAPWRELREEAAFKQALAFHLIGEDRRSVEFLQAFRRDYGGGRLRQHAEALQVELLPKVINELIEARDYLQALTLAEQNRDLLVSGRISSDFLTELGLAFAALWLWDRAARVYTYMLDIARGRPAEENIYLPLIEADYNKADFGLVEERAVEYLGKFPAGHDRARIYYLRVQALYKNKQVKEAADLLRAGAVPESRELHVLAGKIFWELGNYHEVEKHLAKVMAGGMQEAGAEEVFLRAEALFQRGEGRKALPFYQHLLEDQDYADQATYRCAQINLAFGKEEHGLKLLRNLAEKSTSSLWRKMAAETLAIKNL